MSLSNLTSQASYGRRPESIAEIEEQISDIFSKHPEAHFNNAEIPVIPANALPEVIAELSSRYNVDVLNKDEEQQVAAFVRDNPGIEVTPELLLRFVAEATARHNDSRSSDNSSPELSDHSRGRNEVWSRTTRTSSRSSSRDSGNTQSLWTRDSLFSNSRSPDSPFETKSRQRSQPLAGPPSSWTPRPTPAHRRRSDAGSRRGSMSDSESPSQFTRAGPRARVPSTPTSPITYSPESQSPPLPGRPHSRAHSHSNFSIDYGVQRFGAHSPHSPHTDEDAVENGSSPEREGGYRSPSHMDDMLESISSLSMPATHDSDEDEDADGEETHRIGLITDHDRSIASSIASLAPLERLEALQKSNQDLIRRLMDAERTLQSRLGDHEVEIDELQSKLDELKSELTATKREEKELRNKERQNHQQIQVLESELAKLQKTLDSSRALYQNLHKQYIEQCNESEKLRNSLRQKDQDIKNLDEAGQLHQLELFKWNQQREALEAAHTATEQDLAIARQAQAELEDQKQENLVLKETIDRLRFDLDELRTREHGATGGPSSSSSQFGSVSKSLGAELMNKWEALQDGQAEDGEETEEEKSSGSEGEEMIQTIITRKKRRVGGTNKRQLIEMSETKEYADAYTQHDMAEYVKASATQTDPEPSPSMSHSLVQTEPETFRFTHSVDIQTEPEPKRSSMEVQTDPEPEDVTTERESDDELASSSDTLRPSGSATSPLPSDEPPSYDQALSLQALVRTLEEHALDYPRPREPLKYELKIAEAVLKQCHKGVDMPVEALPDGISAEALEYWERLKKEMGADCMVIDKILTSSKKIDKSSDKAKRIQRRRFYNIYNTYFYNKTESALTTIAAPVVVGFVFSTVMFLALSPTPYNVPGMPTYNDRAYWTAFNTLDSAGEGFAGGSSGAIWSVIGRLLLGGAEVVGRVNMPS